MSEILHGENYFPNETEIDKEKILNAMKEAGYEFDDIDSSNDRLVFRGDYGTQMDFPSYEEAGEWLDGVVFDDPEVSDRVERVMHPERFNDFQIETDDLRVFYSYQTKEIYEDLMSDPNRKIAFGTEINGGFNGDCYFTYTDTTKMRNDWREIANITERQGNEREAFLAYALSDRGGIVEVAVESTSDYTNADFNKGFRLVTVDENEGRVVPYGEKVFDTRNEAIKEIIDSPNLVERSYDDVIHKAGDLMTKYSLYGKPAFFKIYPREDGWDNVLKDWRSEEKRDYKVYEEADKWVLYRDFNDLPMEMREPARQLQNALDKAGEVKYYDHRFDIHHTADELLNQVKNNYIDNVDALAKISEILRGENKNDGADLVNLYIDEINESKEHDDYNVARMKIDFLDSREYGRSTGGGLDDFTLSEDADGRSSLTVFYEPSNDTVLMSVNELSANSEGTGATSIPLDEFLKYSREDFDRTVGEIISYGMERTEVERNNEHFIAYPIKEFMDDEDGHIYDGQSISYLHAKTEGRISENGGYYADRTWVYDAVRDFEKRNNIPNPVIGSDGSYEDKDFLYSAYDEYVGMSHYERLERTYGDVVKPIAERCAEHRKADNEKYGSNMPTDIYYSACPIYAELYYAEKQGFTREQMNVVLDYMKLGNEPYPNIIADNMKQARILAQNTRAEIISQLMDKDYSTRDNIISCLQYAKTPEQEDVLIKANSMESAHGITSFFIEVNRDKSLDPNRENDKANVIMDCANRFAERDKDKPFTQQWDVYASEQLVHLALGLNDDGYILNVDEIKLVADKMLADDKSMSNDEIKEFINNERNKAMENSHRENNEISNEVGGSSEIVGGEKVSQKVGRDSYSPQTKDRQEKVNELRNKIKDGVEAVRNEDGYKAWLKTRSHNFINKYSFNNILLVAFQKPDASTVMGYEQWKEYGRQVKAGGKAVSILVPMMYSEKSEGNLCRDICAKLSTELKNGNNPAFYRLQNTDLTFSVTKGNPQIRMSLRGKEWVLQNRSELNAFLQKNVIGKTPRYFNPQSVFDVTDTYTPSVLTMKRGFTENEVIKGKGENVPITNNEGKVLAKAVWSKDADAPKGYDFVDRAEIGKGTWELVSAPDGEPVKTNSKTKDEYLVLNTDERKNRFKDTLDMRVVTKEENEKNMKLLFNALKSVSEDKGVPVKIVSKESEEWGTSKEANGYYHKAQGVELAQYPKGYIVIPTELMNENMAHAVKTLFHECTHADLHENTQKLENEMGQPVSRAMKETQAESVAFMACEAYGIDSSDYSFKYLATWANDAELKDFTDSLKVIDREAKQLVDEVNAKLDEMGYSKDFKELPKDPLSNDAINQKASEIVGSINELNAKVEMMKNQVDILDNEVSTTQNADKAEIVTAMKNNIVKITDEIANQIKLVGELENAQTRVEQNDVFDKLNASNNRVNDLMMAHGSLEESLKTISVRNKEGLHEQFLGNSLSTLNKMSKEYDELKSLSNVQKQYIAKSPYIKEALAPMLNVNPKEFVTKVVERAENAMKVASKTGMFVEAVSCKASTEPAVFVGGDLAHPKVADKIVGEAEKQIRSMKAQRDFQPNTNASLAVYSLTKNKNISCYVANLKIGDGTQISLSDYLHKVAPQKKELLEDFDKATKERGAKDKLISVTAEISHGEKAEKDDKSVTMESAMKEINNERAKNESENSQHESTQQEADKGKNKKERGKE